MRSYEQLAAEVEDEIKQLSSSQFPAAANLARLSAVADAALRRQTEQRSEMAQCKEVVTTAATTASELAQLKSEAERRIATSRTHLKNFDDKFKSMEGELAEHKKAEASAKVWLLLSATGLLSLPSQS